MKKMFTLTPLNGRIYKIEGEEGQSLDIIFASQKCWFNDGQKLLVADEEGNKKEFIVKHKNRV